MGLDCSHNAWHGSYSSFHQWRKKIAELAGLPPLDLMEGFYLRKNVSVINPTLGPQSNQFLTELDAQLPIKWKCLKYTPLIELLNHSDCDGQLFSERCGSIADELEKLLPKMEDESLSWIRASTIQFIHGLRSAAAAGDNLEFR